MTSKNKDYIIGFLSSSGFKINRFPALILCARLSTKQESDNMIGIIKQAIADHNASESKTFYYNFRCWYTDGIMEVRISRL